MRLTTFSDYALRLLMYLAVRREALSTVPEVAAAYGISINHMTKVAHALGQGGYIETIRGRGGGLRLARKPEEVAIGEVVRFTETDMDVVPCFDPENRECPLWRACRLKGALEKARLAFLAVLDDYTLADLTRAPGPMRAHLGLGDLTEKPQ